MTKKVADSMHKAFVDTVKETVKACDKVRIIGFGPFEERTRDSKNMQKSDNGRGYKDCSNKGSDI